MANQGCPVCGARDHFTALGGTCEICRVIDARPRETMTLEAAVAYAREQVAGGATVYLRDVETRTGFAVRDAETARRLDARGATRPYHAVAVR